MREDYNDNQSKTFAEYELRKVLVTQAQTFSQSVTKWNIDFKFNKGMSKLNLKNVADAYLNLYYNIDSPQILSKISKVEREFLYKYNIHWDKITPSIARKLNQIVKKLLNEYGLFNVSSNTGEFF